MEYSVLGKILVPRSNNDKLKSFFIIVGIVSCVLAIILGLIIRNYYSISFIVPLLYLVRLKRTTSSKYSIKDIMMTMVRDSDEMCIIVKNILYINGATYDIKYKYISPSDVSVQFNRDGIVKVIGNYDSYICDNHKEQHRKSGKILELILDNDGLDALKKILIGDKT